MPIGSLTGSTDPYISYNSGNSVAGNGFVLGNYQPYIKPGEKPTVWGSLQNVFGNIGQGIQDFGSAAGNAVNGAVSTATNTVSNFLGNALKNTPFSGIFDLLSGSDANSNNVTEQQPGQTTQTPLIDLSGSSAQSGNNVNGSGASNSGNDLAAPGANDYYWTLYQQTGDTAWLEKYIDNEIERENVSSARAYEEYMSNTGFSRYVKDIESAGYNPWLALQNGGSSAQGYTTQYAGHSGISQSSQATSRYNSNNTNATKLVSTGITTLGRIIAAFLQFMKD